MEIYELLTAQRRDVIEEHFAGKGYGMLKNDLAEVVVETLRPIRKHFDALIADSAELDSILAAGADRARAVAEPKIEEIKRKVGFIVPQDTT